MLAKRWPSLATPPAEASAAGRERMHQGPATPPTQADRLRLLPGINGLRFLAAMMVLIFHIRDVAGVRPPFEFDRNLGSGVLLFFIISAFSLMYSTTPYFQLDGIRPFVIKRLFRIAPLFYAMMIFTLIAGTTGEHSFSEIVLNLTFLFNFFPALRGSIVWAGWTIGVEMIFYALLPLCLAMIKSLRSAMVLVVVATTISGAVIFSSTDTDAGRLAKLMVFPCHAQFFAGGILAFFVYGALRATAPPSKICLPILVGLTVLGVLAKVVPQNDLEIERNFLASLVAYSALVIWQAWKPSFLLSNRFVVYWGERSYSIYLTHGVILIYGRDLWSGIASLGPLSGYLLVCCAAAASVLTVSYATFRFVERPGMRFGASLYRVSS